MVNRWLQVGGSDYSPHSVDDKIKDQISTELKAQGIDVPTEQFIQSINLAVSMYKSHRELENQSSLAEVRKELKRAKNTADRLYHRQPANVKPADHRKLNQLLNNLGSNSRAMIYRATGIYLYQLLNFDLEKKSAFLGSVVEYVDELPTAGRAQEYSRIIFARDLADAFLKELGIWPVTTRSKPFVQVLGILMTDLSIDDFGEEVSAAGLAENALLIWRNKHEKLVDT